MFRLLSIHQRRPLAATDQNEFEWLILPADIASVCRFQEFVVQGAQTACLREEKVWKLELALREALVNVIRYAFSEAEQGSIHVGYRAERPGLFCVVIRDTGRAFDPLSQSAPELHADVRLRRIGGMGILFIRHLADEVVYERADGINHLTLRFLPG